MDEKQGNDKQTVTVCASCLRATCWQGEFYCDDYKTSDITEKTIEELKKLNLEHESYWVEQER